MDGGLAVLAVPVSSGLAPADRLEILPSTAEPGSWLSGSILFVQEKYYYNYHLKANITSTCLLKKEVHELHTVSRPLSTTSYS